MAHEYDKVHPAGPNDMDKCDQKMSSIRFDAIVKMYDFGVRETKGFFFSEGKPLPPQHFVIESKLTLDAIKNSSPYEIGQHIKEMYRKLEDHIEQYEKR